MHQAVGDSRQLVIGVYEAMVQAFQPTNAVRHAIVTLHHAFVRLHQAIDAPHHATGSMRQPAGALRQQDVSTFHTVVPVGQALGRVRDAIVQQFPPPVSA